jgi:hypothetical protein
VFKLATRPGPPRPLPASHAALSLLAADPPADGTSARHEPSTWPHDTVGGGGGARLIRGGTANGPCQARAGRMAARVAKESEGEVLVLRRDLGHVVRGRVPLSGEHEGRPGRAGGFP